MKKLRSILWGIALITVGVIFGLNTLGITNINIFFDGWWTLFIIVPCVIGLFRREDKTANILFLIVGVYLLLSCRGVDMTILWKLLIPTIIILIGLKLILKSLFGSKVEGEMKKLEMKSDKVCNGFAAFSGSYINMDGQTFYGAEWNAVFGGIKCDLRNARIPQDAVIKATAIFGGIDILLPEDVNVKVMSNSIFGGVSNKHSKVTDPNAVTIYIEGSGIFGGVDIK